MPYRSLHWVLLVALLPACSPSSDAPTTAASTSGSDGSGGKGEGGASTASAGDGDGDGDGDGGHAAGGGAGDGGAGPGAGGAPSGGTGGGGGVDVDDIEAGGDRPVTVHVPTNLDGEPAPLLLVLHGYAATGAFAETYFALNQQAAARGVIVAAPDGLADPTTAQYWNGAEACCDYYDANPDDVGYLTGLIDEIASQVPVDPKRVYVLGHSNGGFMAHRMGCDASDRIAAIASLSGAMDYDVDLCEPDEPVSMLEIHGTGDIVVPYDGGFIAGVPFTSAEQTARNWAGLNGCAATVHHAALAHDVVAPAGVDSDVDSYEDCDYDVAVELWTVPGGLHQPALAPDFGNEVLDFLLAHPKP